MDEKQTLDFMAKVAQKVKQQVDPKPWWKSKTLRVNILVVLVAFLGWLAGPAFPLDLGQYGELVAVVLAIVNVILRFMTGQPIESLNRGK